MQYDVYILMDKIIISVTYNKSLIIYIFDQSQRDVWSYQFKNKILK